MTPHQSNGRGTLILDRRFPPPIGRLRRATGLTDPAELTVFTDTMLPALAETSQLQDVLLAIRARTTTVAKALKLWREQKLHTIARAESLTVLHEAMRAYAAERAAGDDADPEHVRKMRTTANHIETHLKAARPEDMHLVLRTLRLNLKAAPFNQARSHLQAFARDVCGLDSAAYKAVQGARRRKAGKRKKGRPYGVAEVRSAAAKLGRAEAAMLWTMVTTGMMPEEYWEKGGAWWEVREDRVYINGTKTESRQRDVPLVVTPMRPVCARRTFGTRLKDAGIHDGTQLYNTRRTYGRALAEAKLVLLHQKAYMGHSLTITELYQQGELPEQLAADAAALRRYFGLPVTAARALGVVS